MKNYALSTLAIALVLVLTGCVGGPKIDPMAFQLSPADSEKVAVADVCKSAYKIDMPRVAVVSFQNNTTYAGNISAASTNATANASVQRGFFSGKASYSSNVETFMREIAPNIGEYAQSAVESTMGVIGGMEIYDRNNLNKIMAEQKFQMTVADPNTAVRLGKLAGVQYIITGSVDNITAKYVAPQQNNNNNQGGTLGLLLTVATAAANTQSGWNVNVEMTTKLIDVTTGQVVINKKVDGREVAGSTPQFNPEMVITAAKKAMGEAVDDLRPDFSQKFAQKGYIQQLRGGKQVALVNLGSKLGMKGGTQLVIMDFSEVVDPMTNARSCNQAEIPVEAVVSSNQIQENASWVKLTGKPEQLARVKLGSIVKRKQFGGQSVFKKMF